MHIALTNENEQGHAFGTALLYLENEKQPYNGGIVYNPSPPNKRHVYDPLQLSGGEKTMAGLALSFAINFAAKSPFVVFDEADSFLDAPNTERFMAFVL